jgi:hypothetical protein
LREVKVMMVYAWRVFHHGDGRGAEVECIVLGSCLEEETLWDDVSDGQGLEEVLEKCNWRKKLVPRMQIRSPEKSTIHFLHYIGVRPDSFAFCRGRLNIGRKKDIVTKLISHHSSRSRAIYIVTHAVTPCFLNNSASSSGVPAKKSAATFLTFDLVLAGARRDMA